MSSSKFYEKLKYELKKKDEKIDELTSMIDSLPGTVYWKDKLGRYVNCNSRMADIFGLDKSEVIGHADHNILSSGQASLLQANDQAVMLSANESGAVFLEKHLGGEGQYFLSHKKNWVGAENKIKGVCGQSLLFDVHKQEMDELRKVKQDLEDQINIKVSFIQNLAHDARTPISGMIGLVEVLSKTTASQSQKEEYIQILRGSLEEYSLYLNNILNSFKDDHEIDLKKDWLAPSLLLDEVERLFSASLLNKKLTISTNDQVGCSTLVYVNEHLLKGALCNIISNAIKFTDEGGIQITIAIIDERLKISVKDTGIGISGGYLDYIFSKFVTLNSDKTIRRTGAGLGLYSAKQNVNRMGGDITVVSEEGEGSEFCIWLPVMKKQVDTPPEKIKPQLYYDSEVHGEMPISGKVLLVEDNDLPALAVKNLLKNFDTKVCIDHAKTLHEASKKISTESYAIIFLDVGLPDGCGYTLTKQIHACERNKHTVIVMLSGYTNDQIKESCVKAGVHEVFAKPLRPSDVIKVILRSYREGSK